VNSTGSEIRIPLSVGIAGHVAATGEQVIIYDAYSDARFDNSVDKRTGFTTRNMMCVPLSVRKGVIIGVVQLINKTETGVLKGGDCLKEKCTPSSVQEDGELISESFSFEDLRFLQVFASQAATAIVQSGTLDQRQKSPDDELQAKERCCEQSETECVRNSNSEDMTKFLRAESHASAGPLDVVVGIASGEMLAKHDSNDESAEESMKTAPSIRRRKRLPCLPRDCLTSHVARATCQLEVMSEAVKSWHFDAFEFAAMTDNQPLNRFFNFLCESFGLFDSMCIDPKKVSRFISEVENGYHDSNPYHNRTHASSVLHSMHALLEHVIAHTDEADSTLEQMRLACWIAAAVHDYDHLGVTNDYLVHSKHERAVMYNDRHVNEQHHAAQAFALMQRAECNFLDVVLPSSAFSRLRRLTIELVLATDMADHGRIMKSFTTVLDTRCGEAGAGVGASAIVHATREESSHLLQIAMKAADLGHLSNDWSTHFRWVDCLEREFFAQGDQERALGMPLSFLMDRNKPGPPQTQVGFYDFMVFPLLRTLVRAAPDTEPILKGAIANQEQWRELYRASAAAEQTQEEE